MSAIVKLFQPAPTTGFEPGRLGPRSSTFILEFLKNVFRISMNVIYMCNRLDSQSDYSFIINN